MLPRSSQGSLISFALLGHRVSISATYGLLLFLLASNRADPLDGVLVAAVVTVSILWHELGHAFAFARFGCGHSSIVLHGFGGVTINGFGGGLSRRRRMLTAAAGPAAGLLLAVPFTILELPYLFPTVDMPSWLSASAVAVADQPRAALAVTTFFYVNGVWSLLNLLPIHPLDGGQILLGFVTPFSKRPARLVAGVSLTLTLALMVWALRASNTWMVVMLALMGYESYELWRRGR